MQYKVTEVLGDWEAQYGKRRVAFRVEGNPNKLSGFFQSVPEVGAEIEGEIVQKGDYWNFSQAKKSAPQASNDLVSGLRLTYAEARAANVTAQKCYTLLTELHSELTKAGVFKLSDGSDFPTF